MANEITLGVGAGAEPDTCGSCKFFERKDAEYNNCTGSYGFCRIVMPAKVASQGDVRYIDPKRKDQEYTGNEDQIKDTDRCDLYRFSGHAYIVQRRIPSGP